MGITAFEVGIIQDIIDVYKVKNVCDLGSQNLYFGQDPPPFMSEWYKERGIDYTSIDLAGDNGSLQIDLAKPIEDNSLLNSFDLVIDAGTSEHVVLSEEYVKQPFHDGYINSVYPKGEVNILEGYYNCWKNKFDLTKVGGFILSVNPKTGNWPGHGYVYLNEQFYIELSLLSDLEPKKLSDHPAMGNKIDGWSVVSIFKKIGNKFPSLEQFSELSIFYK